MCEGAWHGRGKEEDWPHAPWVAPCQLHIKYNVHVYEHIVYVYNVHDQQGLWSVHCVYMTV